MNCLCERRSQREHSERLSVADCPIILQIEGEFSMESPPPKSTFPIRGPEDTVGSTSAAKSQMTGPDLLPRQILWKSLPLDIHCAGAPTAEVGALVPTSRLLRLFESCTLSITKNIPPRPFWLLSHFGPDSVPC